MNGRASGPVLTSLFLFVPDHSGASFSSPFSGVDSTIVFLRVLEFLVDVSENQMALYQKTRANDVAVMPAAARVTSFSGLLDFADLHMECLWRLLEAVERRGGDGGGGGSGGGGDAGVSNQEFVTASARVHVISLLHILTPVLTEKTSHPEHRGASGKFLKLLCSFIDREKEDKSSDEAAAADDDDEVGKRKRMIRECERKIAVMTLTDGAAVFFPDKEARRKQLFSMMTTSAACSDGGDAGKGFENFMDCAMV